MKTCHILGVCVTNNKGFWIGWLDSVTPALQSLLITLNECLRLASFWLDCDWLLFYCDWLGSDLRITHFWFTSAESHTNEPSYRLAVSMENVGCLFVSAEIFVESSFIRKSVSTNPLPWKRVFISQQRSGFQDSTTSIFRIHGHV
jgi:hypothetical protein